MINSSKEISRYTKDILIRRRDRTKTTADIKAKNHFIDYGKHLNSNSSVVTHQFTIQITEIPKEETNAYYDDMNCKISIILPMRIGANKSVLAGLNIHI